MACFDSFLNYHNYCRETEKSGPVSFHTAAVHLLDV